MKWKNEFISWNPNDQCGIKSFFASFDNIWQPDIYINEMTSTEDKSQINPYLIVNNNGEIQDKKSIRIVSSCKINIFKFPFDRQSCNISFSSYVYPVEEVNFMSLSNSTKVFEELKKKYFTPKGDWNLINITVFDYLDKGDTNYSRVIYTITLKRVPVVYIVTLILPACLMVILDLFSMFIPMGSEERLNFKITIVLGFSVLLLILNNMLPTSYTPPILGIFCLVCMAVMVFSIIGCITISYMLMLSESQKNVPRWVKTWILTYLAKLLCFKSFSKNGINIGEPDSVTCK
uniref:Uncharacterized protein n=1 Tax=Pyxicephalus adspersus TaxID=30357 RepID=A0AAV2ZN64_PYXAD|nr:TPA: hypothetical protein GDO54_002522 [Pyxicephalus adspersus]